MDWEVIMSFQTTAPKFVLRLVGVRELYVVDIHSKREIKISKADVLNVKCLEKYYIEGIGSRNGLPIVYISPDDYDYDLEQLFLYGVQR
jgi:hypothetical protein